MSTTQITTLIAFGVIVLLWIIGKLQEVSNYIKYIKALNIANQFLFITQKFNKMAETNDQILSLIAGINDSTNNIAADLQRIADGLAGGLTAEEATNVIEKLTAAATQLKAVADLNPETPAAG